MERKQIITAVFAVLSTLALIPHAAADDTAMLAGSYTVKLKEISSSCTDTSLQLERGTMIIAGRGGQLELRLTGLPTMNGKTRKGGKFKVAAQTSRVAEVRADASFSAAGHGDGRSVELVLVAEYYRDDKALCTQSWDVSGVRR